MKTIATTLLILLLLAGGAASAGDRPLLGKLDAEVVDLAAQADAALVMLFFPDPGPLRRVTWGVLVGDPPMIVTTADGTRTAARLEFQLADGVKGVAELRVRDADLGVAVFDLPSEVAKGRKGLAVEEGEAVSGRIGVIPGSGSAGAVSLLDLSVVRGVRPLTGRFYVRRTREPVRAGVPFVGVDGRLLGIAEAPVRRPPANAGSSGTMSYYTILNSLANEGRSESPDVVPPPGVVPLPQRVQLRQTRVPIQAVLPAQSVPTSLEREGAFLAGSTIARVIGDLNAHGRVHHSYLGIVLGQASGTGDLRGVVVQAVLDGSPAAEAGITRGWLVSTIDGDRVISPAVLSRALLLRRPGETVRLGFAGTTRRFEVVLGDRAEAERRLASPESLGLFCIRLGSELRRFLGIPEEAGGVVVSRVTASSAAARAGLLRGDVIDEAGGEPVADLEELQAAVAGSAGKIAFGVRRGEKRLTVTVSVPSTARRSGAR